MVVDTTPPWRESMTYSSADLSLNVRLLPSSFRMGRSPNGLRRDAICQCRQEEYIGSLNGLLDAIYHTTEIMYRLSGLGRSLRS
ncbi:hypothetical protein C8Q70DRAFT_559978 [Cubamyces menziesii]|nr:hypothetical protein C8Q70DRAFT_559978 [Cubamyces menziesii]